MKNRYAFMLPSAASPMIFCLIVSAALSLTHSASVSQAADDAPLANAVSRQVFGYIFGETLTKYRERGYKDVTLGESFDALNKRKPLKWARTEQPYFYTDSEDGADCYIFDKNDRMICYQRTYDGGTDDYLDQLINVFGKTNQKITSSSRRYSQQLQEFTKVNYSFPETLVQVGFSDVVSVFGGVRTEKHETFVTVVDRQWVEELLINDIQRKLLCVLWIRLAADRLAQSDWLLEHAPALDNAEASSADQLVNFVDKDLYEHNLGKIPKAEQDDEQRKSRCRSDSLCAAYGIDRFAAGPEPVRYVRVNFDRYRRKQDRRPLKVMEMENSRDRGQDALYDVPIVWDLAYKVTSALMQIEFPPVGEDITINKSDDPYKVTYEEWQSRESDGNQWTVRVWWNDQVTVVRKAAKKL